MYYIIDIDDRDTILKIAKGRKVILTGRAVKFFNDVKNIAEEVILCKECANGINYPQKITYFGQAEMIRSGDAKLIITIDEKSFSKILTYLSVLRINAEEDAPEFDTNIGELWCSEKHLEMALVATVEVIQKTLRELVTDDDLLEVHKSIRECLSDLDLICRGKKNAELVCELIDKIRRTRAKAGLWRQKNRLAISEALKEDFRKITGNLAHAEDHLVQYLVQLKKGTKCITCVEDQQT